MMQAAQGGGGGPWGTWDIVFAPKINQSAVIADSLSKAHCAHIANRVIFQTAINH